MHEPDEALERVLRSEKKNPHGVETLRLAFAAQQFSVEEAVANWEVARENQPARYGDKALTVEFLNTVLKEGFLKPFDLRYILIAENLELSTIFDQSVDASVDKQELLQTAEKFHLEMLERIGEAETAAELRRVRLSLMQADRTLNS